MKKLVLLALAGAALAIPAAPASAVCTPNVALGGNTASFCQERVWEKQRYTLTVCTDKNLDNTPESCKAYSFEHYGR